jgi:hypothetical protein
VPKLTKRFVDAADIRQKDYVLWDDELPGFGLRVFASGKRSYVIQYRTAGRSRRYTIGLHGVWTPHGRRRRPSWVGLPRVKIPPRNASSITRRSLSRNYASCIFATSKPASFSAREGAPRRLAPS